MGENEEISKKENEDKEKYKIWFILTFGGLVSFNQKDFR